jgi:hypothetical protein
MATNLNKRFTITLDENTYNQIKILSDKRGEGLTETTRYLLDRGLSLEYSDQSLDLISQIVRKQMELVIKPHVERLARLSSKTGHMAATSTFLNAQALMDLVPDDRRREIRTMYANARKQAVQFMKTKTTEYESEF